MPFFTAHPTFLIPFSSYASYQKLNLFNFQYIDFFLICIATGEAQAARYTTTSSSACLRTPEKNPTTNRGFSIATGEAQVARYTSSAACPRTPEKNPTTNRGFSITPFFKTDTGVNHLTGVKNTHRKHRKRTPMAIF
jgi:hypothetical protein